jgi:hypothetical protein
MVFPYTPEFFDAKADVYKKAAREKTSKAWNNFFEWLGENTLVFDVRMIHPTDEIFEGEDVAYNKTNVSFAKDSPDKEAHIAKLKDLLGENEYQKLSDRRR